VTSSSPDGAERGRLAAATEFGTIHWVRSYLRRRVGLTLTRLLHPRIQFGPLCDVRSGARLQVAKGAGVHIGAGCVLDYGFTLESRGRLDVGDRTVFGHHCTVAADESVVIGEDCLIAELVSIRDHDHAFTSTDVSIIDQGRETAPVLIGDNVWVGAKATITKGVSIGSNSVIGAHAVVTSDLPADCVAVGIPARVIRYRSVGIDSADRSVESQAVEE
jgi:acetyltransferase-like isoleucine patch superfamily enzyme